MMYPSGNYITTSHQTGPETGKSSTLRPENLERQQRHSAKHGTVMNYQWYEKKRSLKIENNITTQKREAISRNSHS